MHGMGEGIGQRLAEAEDQIVDDVVGTPLVHQLTNGVTCLAHGFRVCRDIEADALLLSHDRRIGGLIRPAELGGEENSLSPMPCEMPYLATHPQSLLRVPDQAVIEIDDIKCVTDNTGCCWHVILQCQKGVARQIAGLALQALWCDAVWG
ncbi:hypothetical protein GCM10022226_53050 [Sphaerisporangium flaviroseum]|uniref:Uncharacterized protein n=1 Tax=Sphaerisporangium flaviroseum TaxID=509199 RepID=A0ABP7ISB5_9ACTN